MLNELVGSWKVIGCQLNTRWLPDSIFREFRYRFTPEDSFLLDWSELTYPQFLGGFPKSKSGRVIINVSVSPHQIDFIPDEGPFSGNALLGIFELDHDILKANFAFPGNPRPTEFTAADGQVYEIWQRVG
ncbi:MAG: hypothetical protein AB1648_12075 [Pseudomonadota bacterium]